MKYLDKKFSSKASTKQYRENWDNTFLVEEEIELSEDVIEFINKYAKDNNISFNDAFNEMLKSGLELMEKELGEEKDLIKKD